MKAIRLNFCQMAATMRRDMMLFASCLAPILAGFFFRFAIPLLEAALTGGFHIMAIISPYYKLVDILFAMLPSTMFCFVSAMVSLEEKDEKTAVYLFITPLRKTGDIFARFGVPSVIAFLATIILLPVFKLTALSPITILLLSAGGTLQGMIVALLVLTISSNKLEGMAVTKLSTLTIFGAVIPFFIKSDIQYVISPLPSFWIGKAILENIPLYMLPAFVLSAMWICFLLKQYLRKI
jgi:fluoroquinolone transport system permease protein